MNLSRLWARWLRRAVMTESATAPGSALSPGQRAWRRFKRNRIGVVSLRIVAVLLLLSFAAPLISNEHPLLARYEGRLYVPLLQRNRVASVSVRSRKKLAARTAPG